MFLGLIVGVLLSHVPQASAQIPCEPIPNLEYKGAPAWTGDCQSVPTPIPPTATPTSTSVPPSPTPSATPPPTATPIPVNLLPARSADGTYYITSPGTYSGNASCGNIGASAHCVHVWNSNGVTLQDFTITSAQGYGLQVDNGNVIRRGTITAPLGASGFHKINVTFDAVNFNVQTVAVQLIGSGCENANPRPNRAINVRNSTFVNAGGTEMLYMKCAQDVLIEGNEFAPKSEWAVSLPDGVNVTIQGNHFDLSSEPDNWLGIELPRVFGATVTGNTATGPAGDVMLWTCCETRDLVVSGNTVSGGMSVGVIQPPSTGDAGLR